jgi:hypothetical protein
MNAPFKPPAVRNTIDPRLAFLHRAHALLILVENGLLDLDEAVFSLLKDYCPCIRDRGSK